MGVASRRRLRRAIGRYADAEIDAARARALACHLRDCEDCRRELAMVRAIKGSLRRLADTEPPALAAARLRRWTTTLQNVGGVPPLRSHDCGRIAVVSASDRSDATRRLIRRSTVRRLVGVAAAAGVAAALWVHQSGPSPDPATVAALVELARLDSPGPAAGRGAGSPEELRSHALQLGDQTVSLVRRIVDGREVIIAISDRAFAMPADARPASREPHAPWLARRGNLSVACLSRPTHMLLVGALPAQRLVEVGHQLQPGAP